METIENTTGLQSAPAGQVIYLSKKKIKKETFKPLYKTQTLFQLKQISIKRCLTRNWKICTSKSN